MNKENTKQYFHALLKQLGYEHIDDNMEGAEIWRQSDDKPKMDIIIDFVEHKDNL